MLTQDKFNLTIRTYSKDPCFASRNRLARDKADLQPVFIKRLSFSFLLRELVTVQGDKHGTRDEFSITLYLQSEINFCSVRMPVNA